MQGGEEGGQFDSCRKRYMMRNKIILFIIISRVEKFVRKRALCFAKQKTQK